MKLRVPDRFQSANMTSLSRIVEWHKEVHKYSMKLSKYIDEGTGLLISGPVGVGKSWALVALTREYVRIAMRPDYEFQTAPYLMDAFDEFTQPFDDYRGQPWSRTLIEVPWLVINDFGKEYRAGKLGEQVTYKTGRLLRVRSEKKLVTHITTNLKGDRIKEVYGDSISSLLSEMTIPIVALGPDRRK